MKLAAVAMSVQNTLDTLLEPADELEAERVTERRVRDDARPLEETRRANPLRAVNDLGWQHKIARSDLLPQRADRRESENGADSERLESRDVCSSRNSRWADGVTGAMASQEGDLGA